MPENENAVAIAPDPAPEFAPEPRVRAGWTSRVGGALVLHAGAHEATREQVFETPTPEATETWTPIPHSTLLSLVTAAITASGQVITREGFGLWRNGQRFFGVMEVRNGQRHDDYSMLVGVRNSHDRSFAASLGLGTRVFVCDNQAFSAEVQIARIHSKFILRDLPGLVDKGVALLHDKRGYQDRRIDAYKGYALGDKDAHDIVIRALRARIINVQRVDKVVAQWYEPDHDAFAPRNAWSLFNDFTEALKGSGAALPDRTIKLHGLMDAVVGLPAFQSGTTVIDAETEAAAHGDDPADDYRVEPRDN
jgi:hypothetical protein